MRVVLDTNVLIAALIASDGSCAKLVKHCLQYHTVISAEYILSELSDKLTKKFKRQPADVADTVAFFREQFTMVEPVVLNNPVCRDANDDQILGTALAGQVVCIVTGDKDLLTLSTFAGIQILAPRFLPNLNNLTNLKRELNTQIKIIHNRNLSKETLRCFA